MDEKTLTTLEYPKILERLARYTAFAASTEKALAVRPTANLAEARRLLVETNEAVLLLRTNHDLTIGGARDIRIQVDLAAHGGVLTPVELLDVKSTLVAARNLARTFERIEVQYPYLAEIAARLPATPGLVDAITRAISERGEVLDTASPKLKEIRGELHVAHERLLAKMQRMVSDPKIVPYLQEALITQRDGRYVLPLRADFKGKVRAIVHDQSASGATLFVEPIGAVELNNRYRELQLAERDEERRILADLSNQIGAQAEPVAALVETIAELDLAFARGKYAEDLGTTMPGLLPFKHRSVEQDQQQSGSILRLFQARHPLLDPATVVPIDLELEPPTFAMVITGPNTGGKTVSLKTIGLLVLMAQSGLHIPAQRGSEFSLFEEVFADIGDEQSIEQSLSTFSGHVTNIIHILELADSHSLVILDELGAGTDPQEGAALARALLSHLLERGVTTLVTTHHPELKAFAHSVQGVVNASVEFDLETLRPSYHLTVGLPGRSNALAIASRLGMPETIIASARAELDPSDLRVEGLLDEIHRQRDLSRQSRAATEQAQQEAEALRAELSERLERVEDERRTLLEEARAQSAEQVREVEQELLAARRALARARQPLDALQAIEEQVGELQEKVEEPPERRAPKIKQPGLPRPLRLGDRVRLRSLNAQGVVTALGEEEAEVQVGALRVRSRITDLVRLGGEEIGEKSRGTAVRSKAGGDLSSSRTSTVTRRAPTKGDTPLYSASPGMELDLRGQRADEALEALDRYLDAAYLAGLPFVRIIHGKGTGKLRQSVREALANHPQVKSFEAGGDKEGGEGVTVAKLAS